MPSASGVEMWIESEGNVLPEYQVMHHGPTRTVTCYIPSKVGKTFAVGYRVTTGYQDAYVHGLMGIYSYFDGSSECGRIESMRLNDKTTQKIDSIRVSLKEEKLLTFSDIQLTDDFSETSSVENLENLGSVKVILRRAAQMEDRVDASEIEARCKQTESRFSSMVVHETSKKGGVQQTKLVSKNEDNKGTTGKKPIRFLTLKPLGTDPDPYYTFIFRYRSKGVLRAQGIITSTDPYVRSSGTPVDEDKPFGRYPSDMYVRGESEEDISYYDPNPLRAGFDANGDDDDDDDATAKQLTHLQENQATRQKKRKRFLPVKAASPVVKLEVEPSKRFKGREVIDLTMDD